MMYSEPEYEYELKCEQIAIQIEMFVLDRIIAALERLSTSLEPAAMQTKKTSDNKIPF